MEQELSIKDNDSKMQSEKHIEEDADIQVRKKTARIIKTVAYDKIREHINSCLNENLDISEDYIIGILSLTEDIIDGIDAFI